MLFGKKTDTNDSVTTEDAKNSESSAASKLQRGLKEVNVLQPQRAAPSQSPAKAPILAENSVFEFGGSSEGVVVNGYCPVTGGSLEACEWSVAVSGKKALLKDGHFTTNPSFRIVF